MASMIIKRDYSTGEVAKRTLVQCASASDVSDLEEDETIAPGSVAYLDDLSKVYVMDEDGKFNEASANAILLAVTF